MPDNVLWQRVTVRGLIRVYVSAAAILGLVAWLAFVIVDTNSDFWQAVTSGRSSTYIFNYASTAFLITAAVAYLRLAKNLRVLATVGAIIALSVLLSGVLVTSTKGVFRRVRPHDSIEGHPTITGFFGSWSFPSGDAAGAFALAAGLAPFAGPCWQVALCVLAASVGVNRVLVQGHYPSDVAAGAALGILCALIVLAAWNRWLSRALTPPSTPVEFGCQRAEKRVY